MGYVRMQILLKNLCGKDTVRTKRIIMARVIKRSEDDESFDQEFWDKIGPQGRFAATWQMTQEVEVPLC
jgi:hypothetical protein